MSKQNPFRYSTVSFFDVLMNGMGAFIALFMLSMLQPHQPKKTEEQGYVEGIYRITLTWDGQSNDDVDLYVRDPAEHIAYFSNRDAGLMHLEHDDLGASSNTTTDASGQRIRVEANEEHVILRGTMSGEYIVNVHMYSKRDPGPASVTVVLRRSKDNMALCTRTVALGQRGEEHTAFRFTLNADGEMISTNQLEIALTGGGQQQENQFLLPNQHNPFSGWF